MKDIQSIIEDYRNADFETRQYFFLSYRSLRDEFLTRGYWSKILMGA